MSGTLAALTARMEIQETIQRYATAVDTRAFELLDEVFLADADLDYTGAGGVRGDRDALRDWLRGSRDRLVEWQHLLSPPVIELDGDVARCRTDVYTPIVRGTPGETRLLHTGGRYHDELRRTPAGWRIARRRFERVWTDG